MKIRFLMPMLAAVLLGLAGCETPPPVVEEVDPLWVRSHLSYVETGFLDGRTGWIFPQSLPGNLYAGQAWEYDATIIGIEYTQSLQVPEIADYPAAVPMDAVEAGTVTVMAYPVGFSLDDVRVPPVLGAVPDAMGLGFGKFVEMDEFWAYHKVLEEAGYNLWKLVKLADEDSPSRIFHSLLVLQKLSEEKSEGYVVTVGQVEDVYILIVNRRYVRTKEDVAAFGDWAYAVLQDMGLVALQD
jgi:hypothetical protein